jgi:hypothetical protein
MWNNHITFSGKYFVLSAAASSQGDILLSLQILFKDI